jgi:cell division protein FtsQ
MSRRAAAVRRGLPPAIGVPSQADRRFRRADARPAGGRAFPRLTRRTVGFLMGGLLALGLLAYGAQLLLTSPWLVVRQIAVHGTSRLTPEDVQALVADLRQENILRVDLRHYEHELRGSPWIGAVTLHRQLPATVVVDVVERVPMVFAHLGDRLFLVDQGGVIIDEVGPQYRDLDLPVADGLSPAGDAIGSAVDPWRVALVARFLSALSAAPALRARLSSVDVTDPHDITVQLEGDPTRVKLGDEHFVERLDRYLALVPALRRTLANAEYVDVRFDDLFVMPRGRLSAPPRPSRQP